MSVSVLTLELFTAVAEAFARDRFSLEDRFFLVLDLDLATCDAHLYVLRRDRLLRD